MNYATSHPKKYTGLNKVGSVMTDGLDGEPTRSVKYEYPIFDGFFGPYKTGLAKRMNKQNAINGTSPQYIVSESGFSNWLKYRKGQPHRDGISDMLDKYGATRTARLDRQGHEDRFVPKESDF